MEDLLTWLRQQLDEDERVAQAADSGRWLPEDKGITFEYSADDFHEGEAQARLVADTRANQEHIAEWGPYRVLREVESKRRILDLVAKTREWTNSAAGATAGYAAVVVGDTVRLLALPYADRPGYREEWKP